MLGPADKALSGVRANILRMDAASNNITNVNTPDYKSIRVPTVETVNGGTRGTPVRDDRPGPLGIESDTGKVYENSNSDIGTEFTNLMTAVRGTESNITVIRTSDEILGTLFDIMA